MFHPFGNRIMQIWEMNSPNFQFSNHPQGKVLVKAAITQGKLLQIDSKEEHVL